MKFIANALVGALAGVAYAEQMMDLMDLVPQSKVYKTPFGALVEENSWEQITNKVITFPSEKFIYDYAQQAEYLHNLTETIRAQKMREVNGMVDQPIYTCTSRNMPDGTQADPFEFLPVYAGEIGPTDPTDVYWAAGKCFQNIGFQLTLTSPLSFDLTIDLQNPKHFGCMETIFIANTEIYHIETYAKSGTHQL
jgi:hypothetical protein